MEKIYEKLRQDGAKLIGSCKLPNAPLKEFPNLIYAISIAVKLSDSVLKTIVDRPTISYFQHYRTANARLDQLAFTCVSMIEDLGYNAFPIPASQSDNTQGQNYSGVFQHKTAARLSGLGYIGKNGLLITKEYGSKVRFATVLTDMPLNCETNILENECKGCDLCVKACPGGAISGKIYSEGMKREEFFDAEKCSQNMKKYKDIGRGAVCGICISVCPKNKLNLHKN
jgi:epoxyqueuosine reductase QueG